MSDNSSLSTKQIDPHEPQRKHNWFLRISVGQITFLLAIVAIVVASAFWFSAVRDSSATWLAGLPTQMLFVLLVVLSVVYFREVGWRRIASAWGTIILGTGLLTGIGIDYAFVWVFQAIVVSVIYIKSQMP